MDLISTLRTPVFLESGNDSRPGHPAFRRSTTCFCLALITIFFNGCADAPTSRRATLLDRQQRFEEEGRRISADPIAYLRQLGERCQRLSQYRVTFHRQERLGLIPRLGPVEKIRAAFRQSPFSVKFEWDDPERDYFESVYVQGENDDKLIVRERHGMFKLPPQVRAVNVMDPVKWGKSRNPVTDFGFGRLMARTLKMFDDPEIAPSIKVRYEGLVQLDLIDRSVHHLRIDRPATRTVRYTRQDFYIDTETLLPAGTDLWLPSGELEAKYRYTNVDTDVRLSDADFQLSREQPSSMPMR